MDAPHLNTGGVMVEQDYRVIDHEPVARPTQQILDWSDREIGVLIHYDIEVFDPDADLNTEQVPADKWRPLQLDTDQWIRTAKEAGATYALLTAKHLSGFCLWPTGQHPYHVGNAPVNTDVIGEFFSSCRKYGLKPGVYFGLFSKYMEKICRNADGSIDQEMMNRIYMKQIEEIVIHYGPVYEIWFDGGILRPECGGPDMPGLLQRISPDTICFGGEPGMSNVLRWSGSEQGVAVPECWSAAHWIDGPDHPHVTTDSYGAPADPVWAPVEVDMPPRDVIYAWQGGWMYRKEDDDKTYSGEYLFSRYLTSVGRNANLLLGMLPDQTGRISEDQVASFTEFGRLVRERLGRPAGEATEQQQGSMAVFFNYPVDVSYISAEEDQSDGQRILEWVLETRWPDDWCRNGDDHWIPIAQSQSIGHKRIISIGHLIGYAFRVRIVSGYPNAKLKRVRVYGKPQQYTVYCERKV